MWHLQWKITGGIGFHIYQNVEVDRCSSKENLFGQSALLMNAMYIVFS